MSKDIKVSVCINTYNQVGYIDTLVSGIMSQVSDFEYEVIIYDDCSTDGTFFKLVDLSSKFNGRLKIFQPEVNQYSINQHLPFIKCWSMAIGEYISICEGDDYWIDPFKLQKQFNAIKARDVDICFTNAYMEYSNGFRKKYFSKGVSRVLSLSDVVRSGGGGMPTASILIRASILKSLPVWFMQAPVGDYFIQILGSIRNGAFYLNDITSVYRVASLGSWSSKRKNIKKDVILNEAIRYRFLFSDPLIKCGVAPIDARFSLAKELGSLAGASIRSGDLKSAWLLIRESYKNYKFVSFKHFFLYWVLCVIFVGR